MYFLGCFDTNKALNTIGFYILNSTNLMSLLFFFCDRKITSIDSEQNKTRYIYILKKTTMTMVSLSERKEMDLLNLVQSYF